MESTGREGSPLLSWLALRHLQGKREKDWVCRGAAGLSEERNVHACENSLVTMQESEGWQSKYVNVNISLTGNIMSSSEYKDFGLYVYIFHNSNISTCLIMNINISYWEYTYLPCWGYKYLLYWEYTDICLNKNINIVCPINLSYDKNLSSRAFMIELNIKVINKYEPTCICAAHTT